MYQHSGLIGALSCPMSIYIISSYGRLFGIPIIYFISVPVVLFCFVLCTYCPFVIISIKLYNYRNLVYCYTCIYLLCVLLNICTFKKMVLRIFLCNIVIVNKLFPAIFLYTRWNYVIQIISVSIYFFPIN